jgi:hypothetical protein
MTSPEPLLNSADLQSFQASDPNWFLTAVGDTIRNFCQWHIYPSVTVTESIPIQPDGTIMLPSLYVTGVASVTLGGLELDPTTYHWHQAGYIRRFRQQYSEWPLWPLESDKLPSGIATQISSGPYTISMGALGVVLTDDQRRRLGPFTLVRF